MNITNTSAPSPFGNMIDDITIEKSALYELWLLLYGSTWILDSFYLFIITFISLFGFIFNIFGFMIVYKLTNQNKVLYKYLRVFCINSGILNFIAIFTFYVFSPRFIGIKTDYFARIHFCFLSSYIQTTIYLFGIILDMIISLERLSIFIPRLKKFTRLNPYLVCSISIIVCFIINLPVLFRTFVKSENENSEDLRLSLIDPIKYQYHLCRVWFLYNSTLLQAFSIITRDVLTLILEIIMSFVTVYYFRKFLTKKMAMRSTASNEEKKKNKENSNLMSMTIYLTLVSILSHLSVFLVYFLRLIQPLSFMIFYFIAFLAFSNVIKHAVNFIIFYKFNKSFKKMVLLQLKIKKKREAGRSNTKSAATNTSRLN